MVDDDIDILTLVKTILSVNQFTVETISKWENIHPGVEKFQPDLILLDVSLSGADGTEISRQLKQKSETQHIPVILFSANIEMAKKVADCGAQGYLSKPFMIKDLLQMIRANILTQAAE